MRSSFGIGIPCHNESQNIVRLLEEIESQFDSDFRPESIVIISSASEDKTDDAIRNFIRGSPLSFVLICEKERKGKGRAVNLILRQLKDVDIIFLISADVLPGAGSLRKLYKTFEDPKTGVAGGRPIPEGPESNLTFQLIKLMWDLHHIIALSRPKSTEITAFRNILREIDESTLVDEAELERNLSERGYMIKYVPGALIRNRSPLTLRDYFIHRTRVTRGHMILAREKKYLMGTLRLTERLRAAKILIRLRKFPLKAGILAVVIEGLIYIAAFFLSLKKSKTPGIWKVIKSSKRSLTKPNIQT